MLRWAPIKGGGGGGGGGVVKMGIKQEKGTLRWAPVKRGGH